MLFVRIHKPTNTKIKLLKNFYRTNVCEKYFSNETWTVFFLMPFIFFFLHTFATVGHREIFAFLCLINFMNEKWVMKAEKKNTHHAMMLILAFFQKQNWTLHFKIVINVKSCMVIFAHNKDVFPVALCNSIPTTLEREEKKKWEKGKSFQCF